MLQAADAAAANVSAVLADDGGGGGSVRGGNELEQLTAIANRCEKVHGCARRDRQKESATCE